jgi:hypothetical protein
MLWNCNKCKHKSVTFLIVNFLFKGSSVYMWNRKRRKPRSMKIYNLQTQKYENFTHKFWSMKILAANFEVSKFNYQIRKHENSTHKLRSMKIYYLQTQKYENLLLANSEVWNFNFQKVNFGHKPFNSLQNLHFYRVKNPGKCKTSFKTHFSIHTKKFFKSN